MATDFLMKAASKPNTVYFQVGHGQEVHNCWHRPEDMDTFRTVFASAKEKPSCDVFAEITVALAATYVVFKHSDQAYSTTLLGKAKIVGKINLIVLTNPQIIVLVNFGWVQQLV